MCPFSVKAVDASTKVKRNTEEDSLVGGDLYGILGLTETAEEGEIKSAYRKLSIKHHPDKGGDPKVQPALCQRVFCLQLFRQARNF